MLREMEALFGEEMWDHVVIGVTFWSFDQDIVEDRNKYISKIFITALPN